MEVIKFSAGGFRDFTRIAASDPNTWRDVFLHNREAVLGDARPLHRGSVRAAAGGALRRRRQALRAPSPAPARSAARSSTSVRWTPRRAGLRARAEEGLRPARRERTDLSRPASPALSHFGIRKSERSGLGSGSARRLRPRTEALARSDLVPKRLRASAAAQPARAFSSGRRP